MNRISPELLKYRQNLSLEVKVKMLVNRLFSYISRYGTDGVYVSFSGGKDSTVLLTIAREYFPNIKAVFLDTWLEYPEIRKFVKTFNNVDIIKPQMSMEEVIKQYGWCFPSKDIAEAIYYARKGSRWAINKLNGLDKYGKPSSYRQMYKKWLPLYESSIHISPFCCDEQKEKPILQYERETGRKPILAIMADESSRRREAYLRTGCNSFDSDRVVSKPMGYWTEQDVLRYIKINNIEIAKPYGQIIEKDQIVGQMSFCNTCCSLKTTGEQRTGCMFCPVGCHLDNFSKFTRLKKNYTKLYDYCMEELGEKELIEWIKKHI